MHLMKVTFKSEFHWFGSIELVSMSVAGFFRWQVFKDAEIAFFCCIVKTDIHCNISSKIYALGNKKDDKHSFKCFFEKVSICQRLHNDFLDSFIDRVGFFCINFFIATFSDFV